MRCTFAALTALAALATANPVPGGVTSAVSPNGSPPAGCSTSCSNSFQIQVLKASSKRDVEEALKPRQHTKLVITLSNGVLTDSLGRTGYVASNNQFQFDDPPQAGAIYTAGFSICANGSLAIGGDAVWYQCLSGTFYNLYEQNDAAQCSPVYINAIGGCQGGSPAQYSSASSSSAPVTSAPASSTAAPASSAPSSSSTVCTEYKDGQPQCSSAVSAVSTSSAPACTEYKDGQPQCSSAVVTSSAPACTEYKDGQPQCGGTTGVMPSWGANSTVVSPTMSVVPATGAGATAAVGKQAFGLAAGILAVAML